MALEELIQPLISIADGLKPFVDVKYDYFEVEYSDSVTEVYTYYYGTGDATGELRLTVTIVYTDDTKVRVLSGGKLYGQ